MTEHETGGRPRGENKLGRGISPKNQVLLIALGFFVFNLLLIAIWAWALFGR
jgi:hypothetical protein